MVPPTSVRRPGTHVVHRFATGEVPYLASDGTIVVADKATGQVYILHDDGRKEYIDLEDVK